MQARGEMRKRDERYDRSVRGEWENEVSEEETTDRPSEQIELRTKSCKLYEKRREKKGVLPPLKEKAESVFETSPTAAKK